jgi:hypothetical protein
MPYQCPCFVISPSDPITFVEDALAVPAGRIAPLPPVHTVTDALGAPVVDAMLYGIGKAPPPGFIDRALFAEAAQLRGCYMFGGMFWHHFGHFLFETLARLWAVAQLRERIDGIVFFVPRPMDGISPMHQDVFPLMGIDIPIILMQEPKRIEKLYVPRQGCGFGGLASGTPAFRDYMHGHLWKVPPKGKGTKIYLTREGYGLKRGGYVAEELLRARLEAEGYVAYSPERESFKEQVATYLGASHVLGPDSSAMHLVGFAVPDKTHVGMILRRVGGEQEMLPQIAGFTGRVPTVVNGIRRMLRRDNMKNQTWAMFAEIDLPLIGRKLAEAGFIEGKGDWPDQTDAEREAILAEYRRRLGCNFDTIWERPAVQGAGGA